jgi:hypothetical protein
MESLREAGGCSSEVKLLWYFCCNNIIQVLKLLSEHHLMPPMVVHVVLGVFLNRSSLKNLNV